MSLKEIHVPIKAINKQEINYLHKVIRNAKCDQVDVYYESGSLYIGADSLETKLIAFHKIILEQEVAKKVEVQVVEDATDFADLLSDDFGDLLQNEEVIIDGSDSSEPKVQGFDDPTSKMITPVEVNVKPVMTSIKPVINTPKVSEPPKVAPHPTEPQQSVTSQPQDDVRDIISKNPTEHIYFSTLTEFLQAFLIEDKKAKEVVITINDVTDKVYVKGGDFRFEYPIVNGYKVDISYYMDIMKARTWEKINIESVQKVAKAISSTNSGVLVDMFVTLEKDRVYSENSFLLVSAQSWALQGRYYFTYETVPALVGLPVDSNSTAYVSKSHEMIYLRYNEMYLAWLNDGQVRSENIFASINMDAMTPVLSLVDDDLKKFRLFDRMIAATQVEPDPIVKIETIENGLMKISKEGNMFMLRQECEKGIEVEVDCKALITAAALCTTKDTKGKKIKVKSDLSLKDDHFLLFSNGLDVLINVEGIKRVTEGDK